MSQPVHFVRSDSDENEEEQDRTIPEFIERYETEEQDESIEYEDIVFEGGDSVDEFYYEDEDQPTFHPHAGIIENIQNLSQTGTPNSFGFDFNSSDNEAGFDGNSLTGRFPFKRTLTAKIPDEIPAEDLEHGAVVEAPEVVTCCFGCIPQTPILFFLNVALIISAISGVSIASYTINRGLNGFVGLSSMEQLVISGTLSSPIIIIILGIFVAAAGGVGTHLYYHMWVNDSVPKMRMIFYRSLLILLTMSCLTSAIAVSFASRMAFMKTVYNEQTWPGLTTRYPHYYCQIERKLDCAGFNTNECLDPMKSIKYSYCPGNLCLEFCQTGLNDSKVQALCKACKPDTPQNLKFYSECRHHELSKKPGCETAVEEDLKQTYILIVTALSVFSLNLLLLDLFFLYVTCF